jgi:hypothetical protein
MSGSVRKLKKMANGSSQQSIISYKTTFDRSKLSVLTSLKILKMDPFVILRGSQISLCSFNTSGERLTTSANLPSAAGMFRSRGSIEEKKVTLPKKSLKNGKLLKKTNVELRSRPIVLAAPPQETKQKIKIRPVTTNDRNNLVDIKFKPIKKNYKPKTAIKKGTKARSLPVIGLEFKNNSLASSKSKWSQPKLIMNTSNQILDESISYLEGQRSIYKVI